MRLFLAMACFAVSGASYAGIFDLSPGAYHFKGNWKTPGMTDVWTSETSFTAVEAPTKTIKMSEVLQIHQGDAITTETYELTFVETSDMFFDVMAGADKVGHGYCYEVQCHYEMTTKEEHTETTFSFVDGKIFSLGSSAQEGFSVAWQGAGERVQPVPASH